MPHPDEDGFRPLTFGRQLLQAVARNTPAFQPSGSARAAKVVCTATNAAPAATSIDYTILADRPTITVGEIRKLIANLPDDRPVTILKPDGGDWLNIDGFQNNGDPDGDSEPSAMFTTRDDFDTRQW